MYVCMYMYVYIGLNLRNEKRFAFCYTLLQSDSQSRIIYIKCV